MGSNVKFKKYLKVLRLGVSEDRAQDYVGLTENEKEILYEDDNCLKKVKEAMASFHVELMKNITSGVAEDPRLALEYFRTMNIDRKSSDMSLDIISNAYLKD